MYALLVIIIVIAILIMLLFSEYGREIIIGVLLTVAISSGIFLTGIGMGLIYLVFWLLEVLGVINDNPIEYFLFYLLWEWFDTIAQLDFFRE